MSEKNERSRTHAAAALAAYRASHVDPAAAGERDAVADPDDTACATDLIVDLLHLIESFGDEPRTHVAQHVLDGIRHNYEHESDPVNADEIV